MANEKPGLAWLLALGVAAFLAAVGAAATLALMPPAPLPADAPATAFSAERALALDREFARVPHPAGTPADADARHFLLARLRALGVEAEEWSPLYAHGHEAGQSHLVLARIPGTAPTKAFLLEAHHDSVPYGPGAADDGAGVCAMLEVARALKASPPLRNDILFVFADQEESGMAGARAFTRHPWFRDVGVMLGFEARGNQGTSFMFETSPGNGRLIAHLARAVSKPVATSLMFDVYKRLPFGTDFTTYKRAGAAGYNVAFVGNFAHYHTKNDSAENLCLASLQHHGEYGLGLARHFGSIPLDRPMAAPDAMYFNAFGPWLVHYPLSWGWPLALLTVAVIALGIRRGHLAPAGIAGGAVAFVGACLVAFLTALLLLAAAYGPARLWRLYSRDITYLPDLRGLDHNDLYGAAFAAGALAVLALTYGVLCRRARPQSLAAGALLCWAGALLAMTAVIPGGGYLLQWPLLFAAVGLGLLFLAPAGEALPSRRTVVLTLFAVPGVALIAPTYVAFLWTTMIISGPFLVLPLALLAGLLVPQIAVMSRPSRWWLPGVLGCACAVLMIAGRLTSGPTPLRPRLNSVAYGLDVDARRAYWFSADERPDAWTSQFFPPGTRRQSVKEFVPGCEVPALKAPAPLAPLPGAEVRIVSDQSENGERLLRLRIRSRAARLWLGLNPETEVLSASAFGRPLDGGRDWRLEFNVFPDEGAVLALRLRPAGPVTLRATELFYGLPDVPGVRPRPSDMAPLPNTVHRDEPIRDGHLWVVREVRL